MENHCTVHGICSQPPKPRRALILTSPGARGRCCRTHFHGGALSRCGGAPAGAGRVEGGGRGGRICEGGNAIRV